MGKNSAPEKTEETTGPSAEALAADNADLRAKIEALQKELAGRASGVGGVSAAELAQMLGTNDNPQVRNTEPAVHPGTGKPYFNDLRPTGRA